NILCGIVGYPDLLLLEHRDSELLRSSLLAIKDSGEKASAVVQDLLTLSRRGVLVTDVVNLNEIVAGYVKSPECAHLAANFPEIRLTTQLDPELLNIEGSSLHLFKAVMNLVLNSFEAITPPGTVRLITANRYLDRPVKGYDQVGPGEYVTLCVEDSGAGISPEDTERIFEPFYTKKVLGRSGSGLGLAVVWGAVKDHKGCIIVESQLGRGTSIQLYFPASRRELPARQPSPQIGSYRGRGERVLVVDDLAEQRALLTKILGSLGYQAHAVASGEAAVEFVHAGGAADLVLLDMIMEPGMDGLDTCRALRELRPGLRLIIASGFSETDRVREALRLGAGPHLKKPYRLEHLARLLHETLHAGR
ncbi:MAG TPA: response regulator, partial [Candidatus Methanoperedens sp.]|nr:response regulator [Candidatus Methanoperedens sp.]